MEHLRSLKQKSIQSTFLQEVVMMKRKVLFLLIFLCCIMSGAVVFANDPNYPPPPFEPIPPMDTSGLVSIDPNDYNI